LNRPTVLREPAHVDAVVYQLNLGFPAYSKNYHSKFMGQTVYTVYECVPMDEIAVVLEQPPPPPRYLYDEF